MVAEDADPGFLRTVLSTVTSPLPLDVVIFYRYYDVGYTLRWTIPPPEVQFRGGMRATYDSHQQRFKQLHEMYMVREFRLVLCARDIECAVEHIIRELESIVKVERAKGGLDYLLCEPFVVSEMRSPRNRVHDDDVGGSGRLRVLASAL